MTGCTYGKGNLIHRDYGKSAFTFFRRSDGRAIRVATKRDAFGPQSPEREALSRRVRDGQGSAEERQTFQARQNERTETILSAPIDALFTIQFVDDPTPKKARIHTSHVCERCGEQAMESRVRHFGGQTLCTPCFERLESRS